METQLEFVNNVVNAFADRQIYSLENIFTTVFREKCKQQQNITALTL